MAQRLRLLLAALLMVVTGVMTAGPAAAADPPPVVANQALDLALVTGINQARAKAGAPPLSATQSADIYALFSASGDWACNGQPNPDGPSVLPSFGLDPELFTERVHAQPAASDDITAILADLLNDKSLLDPKLRYVGLASLSGGSQCGDTLRTVVVATDQVAWFGQVVTMVSKANGKYVTAEKGGALPLIANRDRVGQWERFDVVRVSATDVTLRSLANGQYVSAEAAGALPLIANRSSVGTWETFSLVPVDGSTVALASRADNRWVTAESAGRAPLIANRAVIGGWEQFELRGPLGDAFGAEQMRTLAGQQ
ncbi:hypothetical protein FDO65_18075 [Nakamurella flava]|uniref:Uncharacterized protein n=1 Tax=Nakamurella flava TaxID=2576308 RepID=A0A4U6QA25_9ACTN|nr:hypothetical protein [Nakamurella flava]TKV56761.1 hypothetical protein FDO65_18075 [Nakamurella flava]